MTFFNLLIFSIFDQLATTRLSNLPTGVLSIIEWQDKQKEKTLNESKV